MVLKVNVNYLLFADDTSWFSVVHDINASASNLNEDLEKIGNWDLNGKWTLIQILINRLKKLYLIGRKLILC